MKSPIIGGISISRARDQSYNRCINLYPEILETKDGKSKGVLYGCPGLDLLGTIGSGPIWGEVVAPTGVLYVVSGNTLYSVNSSWVGTSLGQVGIVTGPVQMKANALQVLIANGSNLYCLNTQTGNITTPLSSTGASAAAVIAAQDGFALVNYVGTNQFYQSNLNDWSTFSALNFSSADSTPYPIITMFDIHREVWIFKTDRTEVWVNAGLQNFAFQRLQGVQMPQGCIAPYSIDRIGDSLIWLGGDDQGQGVVYMTNGYTAQRVSTHSIEYLIKKWPKMSDAIGYVYQDEGHYFYILTSSSGNQTLCYDITASMQAGFSVWHERAAFSNGAFSRHAGNCHAFAYGKHVIGDYASGNLYAFNLNTYTDNGNVRKWLRSWRAFEQQPESTARFNSLQIQCKTGIDIPDGTSPQFVLRWSDDGGDNWSNEMWVDGDQPGNTGTRVIFQRLGQTKRSSGYDRLFELSGTDPVPIALMSADLDVEPT